MDSKSKISSISCSTCRRDITNSIRMECVECRTENGPFLLCNDCFCVGASLFPHHPSHSYKVHDCLNFPIFTKDWSANDEIMLLDGIKRYGVGNWKGISEAFPQLKSAKQMEDHYWDLYMGIHGYCLPQKTYNQDELVDTRSLITSPSQFEVSVMEGYTKGEVVARDKGKEKEGNNYAKGKYSQSLDLPGYMPLRQDFDIEYENDAEVSLANMEFFDDEHPSERQLKLQVIDIYNDKLRERNERKKFVIERNLVDFKSLQSKERKYSKEERELIARLKVFARFHSVEDHEALVDGMIKAGRLRDQIELFQIYRRMGIRSLEEAKTYEIERRRRDHDSKVRRGRDSSPYLFFENGGELSSGQGNGVNGGALGLNNNSLSSSSSISAGSLSSSMIGSGTNSRRSSSRRSNQSNYNDSNSMEYSGLWDGNDGNKGNWREVNSCNMTNNPSMKDELDSFVAANSNCPSPTDLRGAPQGDLLTEKELELCCQLVMFPSHYLAIKDALIREAFRNGSLTIDGLHRVLELDSRKGQLVYDFFVKELRINHPSCDSYFNSSLLYLPARGMISSRPSSSSAAATLASSPSAPMDDHEDAMEPSRKRIKIEDDNQ